MLWFEHVTLDRHEAQMNFCNNSGLNTRVVCTYIASHDGSEGAARAPRPQNALSFIITAESSNDTSNEQSAVRRDQYVRIATLPSLTTYQC